MAESMNPSLPLCGEGEESHADIPAALLFEYRVPDRFSASGELDDPHYLFLCADPGCLSSAEAHARMAGADPRTVDWRPLEVAEADAILGAVAA